MLYTWRTFSVWIRNIQLRLFLKITQTANSGKPHGGSLVRVMAGAWLFGFGSYGQWPVTSASATIAVHDNVLVANGRAFLCGVKLQL